MVVTMRMKGDFAKINGFLEKSLEAVHFGGLDKYGKMGVDALKNATPRDTGKTAESWFYEIERGNGEVKIVWKNSNENQGIPIALLIQYGHGNGRGAYIQGIDYINPAMKSVFNDIAEIAWKEVTSI